MKKRFIVIISIVVVLGIILFSSSQKKETLVKNTETETAPLSVDTKSVAQEQTVSFELSYPGTISSEGEATLTAQVAGTVTSANLSLNTFVTTGQTLFTIDEAGSGLEQKNGLQSADAQESLLSFQNAEKDYEKAVRDDNQQKTNASKIARAKAKNSRDSAQISYAALLNKRLVKSPISGTVTVKNVSVGSTVSSGTPLATVSRGKKIIRFFINDTERTLFSPLQEISFTKDTSKKNLLIGKVVRVSQSADPTSKRFLVEAESTDPAFKNFSPSSIVTVFASVSKEASPNNFFLPLSAVLREQNGSAVFVYDHGQAKRTSVNIQNIDGETVELSGIADSATLIITTNVKRLKDGDAVTQNQ